MPVFFSAVPFMKRGSNITFLGGNDAISSQVAPFPAHQAGDLILIFAFRDNSVTPPSLPAGYTNIVTGTNTTSSFRVGYKIAINSAQSSGIWTSATFTVVHIYRGVHASTPIGGNNVNTATSTSINYPAVTMAVADGTSWIALGGQIANADTTTVESPPTGFILRQNRSNGTDGEIATFDSNKGVSAHASNTVALGSSREYNAVAIEIRSG